jgi:glycosyltransferase involved in cell wall biosynthesis
VRSETDGGVIEISAPSMLPERPLVTVYMGAYNHEKYISQAIEGVASQKTNFPIELIIGEDCSTDKTRSIAEDYLNQRPDLLRIVTGKCNVGSRDNIRRALSRARGEYLAICEGDDYWIDDQKIYLQIESLKENPACDICFHSCFLEDAASGRRSGPSRRVASRNRTFSKRTVLRGGGAYMPTASIVVNMNVMRTLPEWYYDRGGVGDVYVQAYGARRGGAIYLDRPMSVYRVGMQASWTGRTLNNTDREIEFRQIRIRQVKLMRADFPADGDLLLSMVVGELIGLSGRAAAGGNRKLLDFSLSTLRDLRPDVGLRDRLRIDLSTNAATMETWRRVETAAGSYRGKFAKLAVQAGLV